MPGEVDRAQVRQLLEDQLATDEDFDAFCVDYFYSVQKRFGLSMDRVTKTSLLLKLVPPEEVIQALQKRKHPSLTPAAFRPADQPSGTPRQGRAASGNRRRGVWVLSTAVVAVVAGLLWVLSGGVQRCGTSTPAALPDLSSASSALSQQWADAVSKRNVARMTQILTRLPTTDPSYAAWLKRYEDALSAWMSELTNRKQIKKLTDCYENNKKIEAARDLSRALPIELRVEPLNCKALFRPMQSGEAKPGTPDKQQRIPPKSVPANELYEPQSP